MSNATDKLIEAKKIVLNTLKIAEDQEFSLRICRWLFSLNSTKNGYVIKCYSTKIPDVCFCVDRFEFGDCDSKKVKTWFFRIRKNRLLFFRLIKPNNSYLKLQTAGRGTNVDNTYISAQESEELTFEIIKMHILEAYGLQLAQLSL